MWTVCACVCDHCVMRIETDQCTCTCTCLFHLGHFIVRGKPGKQFLSVVYKGKPTHHRIEDSDGVLTLNKKKYGTTPSSNVPDLIATLSKKCKGWPVVLIAAVSTPVAGEGDYGDTAAVTLSASLHFQHYTTLSICCTFAFNPSTRTCTCAHTHTQHYYY